MIAMGDGYNDLSMIKYAGLGIAMGNAQEPVKAAADYIAPSNRRRWSSHSRRTTLPTCFLEQIALIYKYLLYLCLSKKN